MWLKLVLLLHRVSNDGSLLTLVVNSNQPDHSTFDSVCYDAVYMNI